MPTPESGVPAAIGYAEESGIPYGNGLVKNAYVGRTFIQPSQTIRQLGIRLKLNPLKSVVAGKRLVVIDDSIVRGNTQRALVRMLREAGAKEVHVRISSPPVKWPCFYGIDFASRAELIANGLSVDEIASSLGADFSRLHLPGRHDGSHRAARRKHVHRMLHRQIPDRAAERGTTRQVPLRRWRKGKGGPLAGKAAEVTVERPVPSKPEHAEAVSIETREGTETLETKFDPSAVQVAADDAGMGMCNPGPDADLEALLTEQDRIPANSSATATPKES